ncbi:MAG: histidine kinase [Cellulomonas sp.]|jgi:signal transduction histidine kinase|nr:histidine kinase [Cellulomonas sp.]
MHLGRAIVGPLRRHPALADALLGVVFLVFPLAAHGGLLEDDEVADLSITVPIAVLTVLAALAMTQWRRRPMIALAVTTAVTALSVLGSREAYVAAPALILAVYGFTVRTPRTRALVAVGVVTVVVFLAYMAGGTWRQQEGFIPMLWTAAAVAVAVRSRRATIAALEDRARRAEESREETARRRVAEDRVRIARELHDVIAHHVAVVSVQSGVADHLVERDPAAAREALAHVRAASRTVLAELQSVLGVLRQEESALPTAPAPGLGDLEGLVASFRSMGAQVDTRAPTPVPALSASADVAAFRLVQEALTNVQKHAAGAPAEVRVEEQGAIVVVEVVNARPPNRPPTSNRATDRAADGPEVSPAGSSLGLVGMRERIAAAGGRLETGPTPDGGFRVAARLPLSQEER